MRVPFNVRVLAERLSGKSVFETSYYRESQLTRLVNLFAHVDLDRWRGMNVLEVGAGQGHLGDVFVKLGFDVTSTDGRPEHVASMQKRGRKAFILDLDTTRVDDVGDFGIILCFGVLYHLAKPEEFLRSCGTRSRVLLLETAVCDANEPVLHRVKEAGGWRGTDQALGGQGCRPSPAWVEKMCGEAGFGAIRDISTAAANWVIGSFDWEPRGDGEWRRGDVNLRKMWVCEKTP
jgi:hypothetical protein